MSEEKKNNDKKAQEAEKQPEAPKPDEAAELKDRLLRMAAEFDNYKKRTSKEIENAKTLGKAELMRKLLTVLDEFQLAIEAIESKGENDKGIGLVFSNFRDALKKEGLTEIEAKGVFDPYKHEIMLAKNSKEPEGAIVEVVRKGYSLNGILIRPASVIVSNGKQEEKQEK